ncbi:MAG: recombination protein RecR [Omnitrophica WOR_2 bacterium RBG_13_44_8]|nr:MAG: recombination protein RecR [Omnitrophica WOR_2 bacterium RBG_13_44_8]
MRFLAKPLEDLIEEFRKLPTIGPKTAQRIAFYLLSMSKKEATKLAQAILDLKEKVGYCRVCYNPADSEICEICADTRRDESLICIVEQPVDVGAVEKTGEFRGLYHVLGGSISPIENIGPDEIRIKELLERVRKGNVKEIIVATNPNIEGETTAMYISKIFKPLGIMVTRIASGLPVGGDLEYADEITLGKAMLGRREI